MQKPAKSSRYDDQMKQAEAGEIRTAHEQLSVRKPEGESKCKDLSLDGRIILKSILTK